MTMPHENDILFAHKAINMVAGLSSNERRVAGALVDHFNKRTGQCDPSITRIASLLGIDRATVLRATAKLTDDACGLFEKVSHGGKSHRTKYQPMWARFRRIVEVWEAGMKGENAPAVSADAEPQRSQDCDVDSRKTATLKVAKLRHKLFEGTNRRNSSKGRGAKKSHRIRGKPEKGLSNGAPIPDAQRTMIMGIPGGRSISRSRAAEAQAERRWNADLLMKHRDQYIDLVPEITTDMSDAATRAEIARTGAGLPCLLRALEGQGLRYG